MCTVFITLSCVSSYHLGMIQNYKTVFPGLSYEIDPEPPPTSSWVALVQPTNLVLVVPNITPTDGASAFELASHWYIRKILRWKSHQFCKCGALSPHNRPKYGLATIFAGSQSMQFLLLGLDRTETNHHQLWIWTHFSRDFWVSYLNN